MERESLLPDVHSDCGCESSQGGLCNKHAEEVNDSLCEHRSEFVHNTGWDDDPAWKVICECGWAVWNQPTESAARRTHGLHAQLAWDHENALVPDE